MIVSAMMRKIRIQGAGDTQFLPGAVVDKFKLRDVNVKVKKAGKKPATFNPLLLGVTKAAVQAESFIAAASFQETTKVLTEAALAGKRDNLTGLKENVIVGHMVPAGTGFKEYQMMELCQFSGVPAMPVQSTEDRVEHDPQLCHRELYQELEHPELGRRKFQNAPFRLSETPAVNFKPAPISPPIFVAVSLRVLTQRSKPEALRNPWSGEAPELQPTYFFDL